MTNSHDATMVFLNEASACLFRPASARVSTHHGALATLIIAALTFASMARAQSGPADAATYGAQFRAMWTHSFSRQWFSTLGASFYRQGEQAADSPITAQRHGNMFSGGVGYRLLA